MSTSTFRQALSHQLDTFDEDRTARWHLSMATWYSDTAADQMAKQIDGKAASACPPHSLRFAEMHTQLAMAKLAIEKDEHR